MSRKSKESFSKKSGKVQVNFEKSQEHLVKSQEKFLSLTCGNPESCT